MTDRISRRSFLKASGTAGAAGALASAGAAKWKAAKPLQIGQCVRGVAGCGVFALSLAVDA